MKKLIKEKMEEVVELMNDQDEVVMEKEVIEKLEKILMLLKNPEKVELTTNEHIGRMKEIMQLVDHKIIDLDIDVDYCIPELGAVSEQCDISGSPHILLTYAEDEYSTRTRKVSLGTTALQSTQEDLTEHVVLAIEEFKDEIDDVRMG